MKHNSIPSRFQKRFRAGTVAAALLAGSLLPAAVPAQEPIGPKLTPRLHELLRDEMLSVRQAMEHIMNGLVAGDSSIVANMAMQVHDSFILTQQLTEQDKKDLMKAAPKEFLALDGEFHVTAKKLAHAAEQKDFELQRFYYGKMVDSCQTCHSQFVTDRFPQFAGKAPEGHAH